ncbi:hypothetical protein ACIRBY_32100 [Streptomyces sp. NPDC096136]|uniref:hypothetical protein n=1 Tax=Streptomyces sp. NPDC096136 TaxID=3366076 RepID=UPI00382B321A
MATDGDRQAATRTALVKAGLAAAGAAFFVIALSWPAPWAYAVGAVLLAGSVLAGRHTKKRP